MLFWFFFSIIFDVLTIILSALLGISKSPIRLDDFIKFGGVRGSRMVRVIFLRQIAIGRLKDFCIAVRTNLQNIVVVHWSSVISHRKLTPLNGEENSSCDDVSPLPMRDQRRSILECPQWWKEDSSSETGLTKNRVSQSLVDYCVSGRQGHIATRTRCSYC